MCVEGCNPPLVFHSIIKHTQGEGMFVQLIGVQRASKSSGPLGDLVAS